MEKDRLKEAPLVTTVRTIGLLLSSPMSMYTKQGEVRGDLGSDTGCPPQKRVKYKQGGIFSPTFLFETI